MDECKPLARGAHEESVEALRRASAREASAEAVGPASHGHLTPLYWAPHPLIMRA